MGDIRYLSEPVVSDLTLFFCETFKEEITRIVADISDIAIKIRFFPHFCTSGFFRSEELIQILIDSIESGHKGLYFGDAQIAGMGLLPPEITHVGPDTCTSLIAPAEWIESLFSRGAYVILPGWLSSWEQYVTKMGFDPGEPTAFYSSNLKEIVLLDTRVVPIPEERIKSFKIFSGLPIRIIPVGISHLAGIVHAEINKWMISQVRTTHKHEVGAALESGARQMAVVTLLSDIARVSEEQDVISRILMTCQALFAPRMVNYLSINPEGPGQMITIPPDPDDEMHKALLLSSQKKEFLLSPEKAGFCVPIMYQLETIGILGIYGVSIPDRIREYLNLTLSFTRFLGLAIKNARSWHEITETRDKLKTVNVELQNKNEELLAISEELSASNQELIHSKQILTDSEQFIKAIVSSAQVGIGVLDPEFHILFWNQEMERMFGMLYRDIRGQNFLEIFPQVIQNKRETHLLQALQGEVSQAPDFEFSPEDSREPFWISSIYSPVYDLNQNIIGVIINVNDITGRKESERNLERAYDAIHIAQEKLAILSSITRHDILNRVMVISAYSEMLLETESDEKAIKQLTSIAVASKDIQNLIEFTREYQELGVKKPTWQQLGEVMQRRSVQSVLSDIALIIQGIAAEIYVDPMFEKVMYNLVENSKRHGERVSTISIITRQAGKEIFGSSSFQVGKSNFS